MWRRASCPSPTDPAAPAGLAARHMTIVMAVRTHTPQRPPTCLCTLVPDLRPHSSGLHHGAEGEGLTAWPGDGAGRSRCPSSWLTRRLSPRGHGARWGTRCEELASIVVCGPKSFSWSNSSAMLSQSTKQSCSFKLCYFHILFSLFHHPSFCSLSPVCA